MREERKLFCIKIMDMKIFVVPYTLGRTIAFSIRKESIGYLLWVVFCIFFFFFLHFSDIYLQNNVVSYEVLNDIIHSAKKQKAQKHLK